MGDKAEQEAQSQLLGSISSSSQPHPPNLEQVEETLRKEPSGLLSVLTQVALTGVAQWIEHGPANQRVAGLIPSRGTCLGCEGGSLVQGVREATTH